MLDSNELRAVYCESLIALAEKDERIMVVEADLMKAAGTGPFKDRFPDRTVNVGVAEANMIAVSAGLAAFGKVPFAHSFSVFASRRCFDQIAISVAYAGLNVKICGTDPGITAELNGGTHMGMEDIGILRTLTGMTIFEPADAAQLTQAMPQLADHNGPVYIRLYRKPAETIYGNRYIFKLGKADVLKEGHDAAIIAGGIMVKKSLDAAEMLANEGLCIRVINLHTIKPIDEETVIRAAMETGAVVTAENHNVIGGLGSAVAEVLAENHPVPMERVGVRERFGEVGRMETLEKVFGLTADDIAEAVRDVVKRKTLHPS